MGVWVKGNDVGRIEETNAVGTSHVNRIFQASNDKNIRVYFNYSRLTTAWQK